MFRTTSTRVYDSRSINNEIIYAITIDDYEQFLKLITEDKIDSVIDNKNGYSALHYAIMFGREKMIKYLLDLNASLDLKTFNGLDAYDIALKYQAKSLIIYQLKKKDEERKSLLADNNNLNKKINVVETNNRYLTKTNGELINKNESLKIEVSNLKKENTTLKNKVDSLTKDNTNLSNQKIDLNNKFVRSNDELSSLKINYQTLNESNNSLKRKYDNLEKSYDGLLTKIKK